jgi:hypothetical protein
MARLIGKMLINVVLDVVLAVVFFVLVTPLGAVLRRVKDPLRRRPEPAAESYWEPLTR